MRASRLYPIIYDGEWFYPADKFRIRCCDCDLIHDVDFKIERGWIAMRVYRDKRATAQARRNAGRRNNRVPVVGSGTRR